MFQTTCFPLSLPMPYFNIKDIQEKFTVKKAVLNYFTNFTGAHSYWSPFLSSCRDTACNFIKCELYETSLSNSTQDNRQRLFLDVKRCC